MLENLDIKINNQMLSIISEIDEFKGSWKLLGKMAPEKLRALKKVATIESVGSSNRIEGNKLTDKQVEELLDKDLINQEKEVDETDMPHIRQQAFKKKIDNTIKAVYYTIMVIAALYIVFYIYVLIKSKSLSKLIAESIGKSLIMPNYSRNDIFSMVESS